MIVLPTCTSFKTVIWSVFAIDIRSTRHLCTLMLHGVVEQDFVLKGCNSRPPWACVANEYIEREKDRTYGQACPSPYIHPIEHVWDILQ